MNNLERLAQVEELHARRAVFADSMNAERLAEWKTRKAALCIGVDSNPNRASPCITKQSQEEMVVARLNWPNHRASGRCSIPA